MATQKFKPGDKVKFTQEAKDRFGDGKYWHCADYESLDLDRVYTVKDYDDNKDWPSYSLEEEDTAPHIADYLLEPAEAELSKAPWLYAAEQTKLKHMTKKEFFLKLGKALFPGKTVEYKGIKPHSLLVLPDMGTAIEVKVQKTDRDGCTIRLVPVDGCFESSDIYKTNKFLKKLIPGLDYCIHLDNMNMGLVFSADDYPWILASYCETAQSIQELEEPATTENPCDNCEALRKANADKLRLQHELGEAKAEIAKLRSQVKKGNPQKGEPWCKTFEVPGGHGIAFGFSF